MSKSTPPRGFSPQAVERRREWLAERTGQTVPALPDIDSPQEFDGLAENQVGYLAVPLSVAGPLVVRGDFAKGTYCLPLCTLEGTLAFSMTRGCYLTSLCGGVTTQHLQQEMSRCPIFLFDDAGNARRFVAWLEANFTSLKEVAESTTRHGRLLRLEPRLVHDRVLVEFFYYTGEAAGQNMVTIATDRACRFIQEQLADVLPCPYLLESNFACDKTPGYKALLDGRGHSVAASCLLEERTLRRVMRTGIDELLESYSAMQLGSSLAGNLGLNLHTSNALAALFLATGQDIACLAENSVSSVHVERRGGELRASITMPSLTVGTVGGATRLRGQRRNLEMLGCTGPDSSKKLAEIICAAALCLEISLGASVVSNEFAASHMNFGRKSRVDRAHAAGIDANVLDGPLHNGPLINGPLLDGPVLDGFPGGSPNGRSTEEQQCLNSLGT